MRELSIHTDSKMFIEISHSETEAETFGMTKLVPGSTGDFSGALTTVLRLHLSLWIDFSRPSRFICLCITLQVLPWCRWATLKISAAACSSQLIVTS
jgi:hypothetical protein